MVFGPMAAVNDLLALLPLLLQSVSHKVEVFVWVTYFFPTGRWLVYKTVVLLVRSSVAKVG